jgi:hypothetical protein
MEVSVLSRGWAGASGPHLWSALDALPDDVMSQPVPSAPWTCLKDRVFHTITCEDSWLHLDLQRRESVLAQTPALRDLTGDEACGALSRTARAASASGRVRAH